MTSPSSWLADMCAALPEGLRSAAADQADQARELAAAAGLSDEADQALTDAFWLGEWGREQSADYPASPAAIAARAAWDAHAPRAASLLTHAGYLPYMEPPQPQDTALLDAHPAPEGWGDSWEAVADVYDLCLSLRSGMDRWGNAGQALEAVQRRWGRHATITHAVTVLLAGTPERQERIRERVDASRERVPVEP